MTRSSAAAFRWWPLLVAATVGPTFCGMCFYPGAMSFDTAAIWSQARGAPSNNIHGVGWLWLWRATEPIWSGPAPLFLLQLVLLWSGLALIARSLPVGSLRRIAFMWIAAMAPGLFVLFAHVWSDALLCAALTCACAAALRYRDTGNRFWAALFLLALLFTLTLRHNALPATLPLIVYFADLWTKRSGRRRMPGLGLSAAAILLVLGGSAVWLDAQVDRPISVFPVTAIWDLAAISIDANEDLLPDELHRPGLTVDDLRSAYTGYSSLPIFTSTGRISAPFFPADDARVTILRRAWLAALIAHPGAYIAHRWRVTQALFGSKPRAWPHELIYVDDEFQFGDNPPIAANRSALHTACMRAIEALRNTLAFAVWPYLVLALTALTLAWRRRSQANAQAALAVLASGLLYAAPLPVIAPSAELRFLGWTCMAAIIGAALALSAARAHGGDGIERS